MAVSSVALAGVAKTESYKDIFPDITYSGSAGSLPWEKPWSEVGDDGSPSSGLVHVYTGGCYDYKCLNIEGHGDVGTLGAKRYADLSIFTQAEVCFDVVVELLGDESLTSGTLAVQATSDGANWKTIDTYSLQNLNRISQHGQQPLDDYLSEGFGIRFVVTGALEGEVYIDNVEIKGTVVVPATTSTSSSTTSSSSTSTSSSTTSTTKPNVTTTSEPKSTTTTERKATTTTTDRAVDTTTEGGTTGDTGRTGTTPKPDSTTTSTTVVESTTTTVAAIVPAGPIDPPPNTGLRETPKGVQADYSTELFGAMDMEDAEVLSVELEANYSMAVEVFSSSWIWVVALLVIIATAIVTGLDRRRTDKGPVAA